MTTLRNPPAKAGRIVSLTYHEITADARVLKEARALKAAGYDVHILCDRPDGFPEQDEIDGILITRFRCFGMQGVATAAFHEMSFLRQSKETVAGRYLPYAKACENMGEFRTWLEDRFGRDAFERMQSSYYKMHRGRRRMARQLSYLWLKLLLRLGAIGLPPGSSFAKTRSLHRKLRHALRDLKAYKHELYQAQSVVYWSNCRALGPDEAVLAVHAHDIYCLPAGVMLARRYGVPLVYDAHEYEPARPTKMSASASQLPEYIENDCFPHVARMITVSESIGELYAGRYDGPRPVIVMNAPEIEPGETKGGVHVRAGLKTVREQMELPGDVPLVVFTGGIQRSHRGMDKVLEALVHMPGVFLANLGPRHSANDEWFMDIARKLGVDARVRLLPPVDARDVPAAISTADVAVCPLQDVSLNHRFAMPNKLFEAAFAQVPICVSDLPEMRSFVETLGTGRAMDQTDPERIAEALLDVIEHRENYRLTPQMLQKLDELYSWPVQAEKLVALYAELLSDAATSRSTMRSAASPLP